MISLLWSIATGITDTLIMWLNAATSHLCMNQLYKLINLSFLALFHFVFSILLHPVFYFSVQSLSQSHRSRVFYVMEQNNRHKCILAIRMSPVSGPEMVGQRWMARGIQLSCVQAYSHQPLFLSFSLPSFFQLLFCFLSLSRFLFWLHDGGV